MIAIIDYGMGNLRSVQKAFEFLDLPAVITDESDVIKEASHVVLPGVGAFPDAMKALKQQKLIPAIYEVVDSGKPFLGICLGMQLLFESSCEFGECKGLNLIPGIIKKLPNTLGVKIPHMGWNVLNYKPNELFRGLPEEPYVYYVHSYYLETEYSEFVCGTTDYGMEIQIAAKRDNIFGLQFHPEKSGGAGLKILKNFGGLE